MDFMNRGVRNGQPAGQPNDQNFNTGLPADNGSNKRGKLNKGVGNLNKVSSAALVAVVLILVAALLAFVVMRGFGGEKRLVDGSKYQAVFLNGGQVYFGNIKDLNNKYMSLDNIYYLRVNQQVQPNANTSSNNDISLVKLGCELHGPQDRMVVNREQVIFWENLKDDGQVAKAIGEYKKQYPNGQKCEDQNNASSNNNSSSTTEESNSTNNSSTNTTPSPTPNPSSNTNNNTRR